MTLRATPLIRVAFLIGTSVLFGLGTAVAQTGPGGVGDATGSTASESLSIWLRSDEGVIKATGNDSQTGNTEVELWEDQSGQGHDHDEVDDNKNRQPIYEANALNGKPVIKFNTTNQDNTDALRNTQTAVKNIAGGSNTFFVLSIAREVPSDNFWQVIHFNQNENIGYNTSGEVVADQNGPTLKTSSPTLTEYNVFSSVFDENDAEEDLAVNGTVNISATGVSTASKDFFEIGKNGTAAKENVVEVIGFKSALNTAQRRLVANYLAEKHGLTMASNDYYRFGSGHPNDIVGIGRATKDAGASNGGRHPEATSSRLTLLEDGNNALNDGEFVMVGHDGAADGSFTTTERPNGSSNAKKIEREWRAEVTGTGSKNVDVEVDYSSLSLPAGYDDRALFVDDDGDFTSGATYHDLDNKSGDIYEASGVDISDGDYVAVAAIKRVVNFSRLSGRKREGGSDLTVDASLNFPTDADDSGVSVDFSTTGNIDSPTGIQDNGVDNGSGSNDNGDYEADGTDYSLNSPSEIPAGATSAPLDISITDDSKTSSSPYEQTEKFEVILGSVGSNAAKGSDDRFVGSIIDNDHPDEIAYTSSSDNDSRSKTDAGYNETTQTEKNKTLVYEVALDDGKDGNTGPDTKATYEVTGGTATPGTDFRLVNGKDGSKETSTLGKVTIPDVENEGQFEIKVLDDNDKYEGDETVELTLTAAQGGTIDGNDKTALTLTISEDDSQPDVSFASDLFTKREGQDASLTVELSEAAGTDIDVTFGDEGTGSASSGGTDYTFPVSSTITIPAGNTSGTFTIPVNDDTQKETNETIDVGITSATGANLGSNPSATHEIIDNDGIGSMGPGGVGGAQTLAFWGKADGLGATYNDGNDVNPWPDSSGNGNDATKTANCNENKASFVESGPNGQPVLNFEGNDCYKYSASVLESLPDADYTMFSIAKGGSQSKQALLDIQTSGCNSRRLSFRYENFGNDPDERVAILNNDGGGNLKKEANTDGSLGDGPFHLISAESESEELDISFEGQEGGSTQYSSLAGTGDEVYTGMTCGNQEKFGGRIAELIFYDASLNTAQRNIVRNALSAKYDVGLDANNLYAGDQNGNGDYDFSVIGIGKEGGADVDFAHTRATGGGITLTAARVGDGEYVMFGTNAENPYAPAEQVNYEGTSGIDDLAARPDSAWFVDVTGTPSFDVAFDLTSLGFDSRSRQPDGYVLLTAPSSCTPGSNDCTWSDAGGSVTVSGDEVTFSDVSVSGTKYLAIGTTAPTESPLLNAYARPVEGQAGTDGADEGWRYVGVPVEGAVIDSLQPPLSNDRDGLVGFGVRDVWHWALNNGTSKNNDGWTQLDSGHQMPNGRGVIVHLHDDSEHPIDPTLWMDVASVTSSPPGDADVTVGNGAPSADTKLRTDTTWHLLANPYKRDYDLSALNTATDGDGDSTDDFKGGVQLWDPYDKSYKTVMKAGDNSDHLALWEAFFLQRNDFDGGASTDITFTKSGRQSTTNEDYIGSKRRKDPSYRRIDLRVVVENGSGTERALDKAAGIYFHEDATASEDAYDLSKLMPAQQDFVALSAVAADRHGDRSLWAMHSRPHASGDTITVPLDLQTDLSGTFKISAPDWANVPDGWTATLIDTKGTTDPSDDTEHTLGRGGQDPYTFDRAKSKSKKAGAPETTEDTTTTKNGREAEVSGDSASPLPPVRTLSPDAQASSKKDGASARFRLRIDATNSSADGPSDDESSGEESSDGSTEPPPAEIASITPTVDGKTIRLSWKTSREDSGVTFEVQHQRLPLEDTSATPDPNEWTQKASVDASASKSSHKYTAPLKEKEFDYGRHVFRLRMVDAAGTSATSDKQAEAKVRLAGAYTVGKPYPNPVGQAESATLEFAVREEQSVRIFLYDILGRRIRTAHRGTVPARETKKIRIDGDRLSSGTYFLRIHGEDFVETRRMTVVR
ncbi:MAG: hypothetical protein BRD55_08420 [Bacteroidetes bacterium SW_9_63_38]|nr:MAG: hypothetical protein BRD55_08420 [Bacteroidetes bacterium SW_9_63_38]